MFIEQVKDTLFGLPARIFINFELAPTKKDREEATDMVAIINGRERLALCIRRPVAFET